MYFTTYDSKDVSYPWIISNIILMIKNSRTVTDNEDNEVTERLTSGS